MDRQPRKLPGHLSELGFGTVAPAKPCSATICMDQAQSYLQHQLHGQGYSWQDDFPTQDDDFLLLPSAAGAQPLVCHTQTHRKTGLFFKQTHAPSQRNLYIFDNEHLKGEA